MGTITLPSKQSRRAFPPLHAVERGALTHTRSHWPHSQARRVAKRAALFAQAVVRLARLSSLGFSSAPATGARDSAPRAQACRPPQAFPTRLRAFGTARLSTRLSCPRSDNANRQWEISSSTQCCQLHTSTKPIGNCNGSGTRSPSTHTSRRNCSSKDLPPQSHSANFTMFRWHVPGLYGHAAQRAVRFVHAVMCTAVEKLNTFHP